MLTEPHRGKGGAVRAGMLAARGRRRMFMDVDLATPLEFVAPCLSRLDAGADVVKVFPATGLGPGFLKDVRGPLPHVKLMPTGGVTLDNASDWIRAGAVAVGVGTALLDASAIGNGNYQVLTANARRIIDNVRAAREQR